jgi:hypothetical protein
LPFAAAAGGRCQLAARSPSLFRGDPGTAPHVIRPTVFRVVRGHA